MDFPDLTPGEIAGLRELLKSNGLGHLTPKIAQSPPTIYKRLGKIGGFIVAAVGGISFAVDVLLLPSKLDSLQKYYAPKSSVYQEVAAVADKLSTGEIDASTIQPTHTYLVVKPFENFSQPINPSDANGSTIIASTAVEPRILPASGYLFSA